MYISMYSEPDGETLGYSPAEMIAFFSPVTPPLYALSPNGLLLHFEPLRHCLMLTFTTSSLLSAILFPHLLICVILSSAS